jgi:predicted PurR-regulated permease PerM
MSVRKVQFPIYFQLTITLMGIVLFFGVMTVAGGILIPLTFGMVFSLALLRLCQRLENLKIPRSIAILICLLLIILVLTVIFSLIYNNLLTFNKEVPQMRERIVELLDEAQAWVEKRFEMTPEKQRSWLNENINTFAGMGISMMNGILGSATTFFSYLLLVPIYMFFMLYYRHIFKGFLLRVIDREHRERAIAIEEQILNVTQKYIAGLFTVILIIACLNIAGLWLIGIRHAVFFGALAAILTVIPYIGVFIGSLLPILYALVMTDSLLYPLAVFIWFQAVQALEGNFITPNIVGSQVSLNPLVAIVALLLGAWVWGVPGMILFTPLTAMLKVFLDNIPELSPYGYLLSEGDKVAKPSSNKSIWKKWFGKNKNTGNQSEQAKSSLPAK